jgi:hypothetical protein
VSERDLLEAAELAHERLRLIALCAGLSSAPDADQASRLYVAGHITLDEFEDILGAVLAVESL